MLSTHLGKFQKQGRSKVLLYKSDGISVGKFLSSVESRGTIIYYLYSWYLLNAGVRWLLCIKGPFILPSVELVLGIVDEKDEVRLHVKAWNDDLAIFLILELRNNKKDPLQCSKMFFWSKVVNTNKIQTLEYCYFNLSWKPQRCSLRRHLKVFQRNSVFSSLEVL